MAQTQLLCPRASASPDSSIGGSSSIWLPLTELHLRLLEDTCDIQEKEVSVSLLFAVPTSSGNN